jgi:hypothetical protein
LTSALEGGEGSASRLSRTLPPGKTRYLLYRRLSGPQDRSGQVRKISSPPEFDPRTVQPVGSRFTDYTTRPTCVSYWQTLLHLGRKYIYIYMYIYIHISIVYMNTGMLTREMQKFVNVYRLSLCMIALMYTNTASTSLSPYESLYCDYIDISLSMQSTNHLRIIQGRNTCVCFR